MVRIQIRAHVIKTKYKAYEQKAIINFLLRIAELDLTRPGKGIKLAKFQELENV